MTCVDKLVTLTMWPLRGDANKTSKIERKKGKIENAPKNLSTRYSNPRNNITRSLIWWVTRVCRPWWNIKNLALEFNRKPEARKIETHLRHLRSYFTVTFSFIGKVNKRHIRVRFFTKDSLHKNTFLTVQAGLSHPHLWGFFPGVFPSFSPTTMPHFLQNKIARYGLTKKFLDDAFNRICFGVALPT